VGFFCDTLHGEPALKAMIEKLHASGTLIRASNIYKRQSPDLSERPKLYMVVLIETLLSKEDLHRGIALLKTLRAGFSSGAQLLAFDQIVQLVPGSTLPHPVFLQDFAFLQCASEIWGDYEHPILNTTLNELVKTGRYKDDNLEFFSQGMDLL
jgi:7,8-dihydro-6-hydroxymethylpterin-pyrophosphokinase